VFVWFALEAGTVAGACQLVLPLPTTGNSARESILSEPSGHDPREPGWVRDRVCAADVCPREPAVSSPSTTWHGRRVYPHRDRSQTGPEGLFAVDSFRGIPFVRLALSIYSRSGLTETPGLARPSPRWASDASAGLNRSNLPLRVMPIAITMPRYALYFAPCSPSS
jgi:hypothetical protein